MIKLYQFAFSHFCEKARWALDYKGIPYTTVNLLPGLHIKPAQKLAPKTCLPILVAGKTIVQDSAAVITHLDRTNPNPLLTPRDPREAREALDWEQYLDDEIGVTIRCWFYYHALPDRKRAMKFIMTGAPWYGPPLYAVIFPKVREAMLQGMNINADTAKDALNRLGGALDKLDAALKDRRFLVGDRFSRADLTACALLSPMVLPDDRQAAELFPEAVMAARNQHKGRRYFGWVRNVYDNYTADAGRNPRCGLEKAKCFSIFPNSAPLCCSSSHALHARRAKWSKRSPAQRLSQRPMCGRRKREWRSSKMEGMHSMRRLR